MSDQVNQHVGTPVTIGNRKYIIDALGVIYPVDTDDTPSSVRAADSDSSSDDTFYTAVTHQSEDTVQTDDVVTDNVSPEDSVQTADDVVTDNVSAKDRLAAVVDHLASYSDDVNSVASDEVVLVTIPDDFNTPATVYTESTTRYLKLACHTFNLASFSRKVLLMSNKCRTIYPTVVFGIWRWSDFFEKLRCRYINILQRPDFLPSRKERAFDVDVYNYLFDADGSARPENELSSEDWCWRPRVRDPLRYAVTKMATKMNMIGLPVSSLARSHGLVMDHLEKVQYGTGDGLSNAVRACVRG